MKKALFIINDSLGHLNGSLKVSIPLQKQGYQIHYVTGERHRMWCKLHKFNFCQTFFYKKKYIPKTSSNIVVKMGNHFLSKLSSSKLEKRILDILELEEVGDFVSPDLVFIDSFLIDFYVAFVDFSCTCFQLENYVYPQRAVNIPPLNSLIIPSSSFLKRKYISLIWAVLFFKKSILNFYMKGIAFFQDNDSLWLASLSYFGISYNYKVQAYLFRRRVQEIPCVVTTPRYFDYPREIPYNVFYTNNFVESPKNNQDYTNSPLNKVLASIKSHSKNEKIIYCSFGTFFSIHSKKTKQIIKKILEVFTDLKECHMIFSLGGDVTTVESKVPENTHIFDFVDQSEVLKHVDMVITHGGINTISECIFAEIPMLVFPLNSRWDQNGNAARVEYHKIGLMGNIVKENKNQIIKKINRIKNDNKFQRNVSDLKDRILGDNGEISFFHFLREHDKNI